MVLVLSQVFQHEAYMCCDPEKGLNRTGTHKRSFSTKDQGPRTDLNQVRITIPFRRKLTIKTNMRIQ